MIQAWSVGSGSHIMKEIMSIPATACPALSVAKDGVG
jgi:hypothetical protein